VKKKAAISGIKRRIGGTGIYRKMISASYRMSLANRSK